MPDPVDTNVATSLGIAAARKLATTTKTVPQMQGITSRWLLRILPWVQVSGGSYRVNRRLSYPVGEGLVSFATTGEAVQVIPHSLAELPLLRGFADADTLTALAGSFVQSEVEPGAVIVEAGQPADRVVLIVHGKVNQIREGKYEDDAVLALLASGSHFGDAQLAEPQDVWNSTVKAVTGATVLTLTRQAFEVLVSTHPALAAQVSQFRTRPALPQNRHGEADIQMASGHAGPDRAQPEPVLPATFADYEESPREYELSVAQTVLRIHTRVADLLNDPMNQTEQQLRLTVEALRERQESELINNPAFGLLHNADLRQRIYTRTGPPTPDDLDELLSRRRNTHYILAHPRAIAAFGRECNHLGLYPPSVPVLDNSPSMAPSWRGVPILPCNKIPIDPATRTTTIIAMRTGEELQGVVGLHQTGIPDEHQPSLNVRFMGIDEKAVISYLVSAYYSAAVLVPDALGILEDVEIGH